LSCPGIGEIDTSEIDQVAEWRILRDGPVRVQVDAGGDIMMSVNELSAETELMRSFNPAEIVVNAGVGSRVLQIGDRAVAAYAEETGYGDARIIGLVGEGIHPQTLPVGVVIGLVQNRRTRGSNAKWIDKIGAENVSVANRQIVNLGMVGIGIQRERIPSYICGGVL
jgi:hypothetical protein